MEASTENDATVRFLDLGPLMIEVAGHTRTPGGARPAAALAVLLVHADRPVTVDALGAAMWDDGRPRTTSTLESHLWRLRRVLEPDRRPGAAPSLLVTEPGGYRLAVASDQVDSLRFAELVERAANLLARGDPATALHHCEQARGLWRGRPFAPVADQPWAAPAVARLEELRAQLDERHVEALLALHRPEQALVELETALGEHPLRERLWAQRMLAAYRAGRVDDAVAAYGRARTLLLDELGTEPGAELRDLHGRVLAADPSLRPETPPAVAAADDRPVLPTHVGRLVGRDHELEHLVGLVSEPSLVTVCGPAGVGKTRLAVEAARRAAATVPDGVWFVDLTGAHDADRIVDALTTTLGLAGPTAGAPVDALAAFVRRRRALVVLDDCEHVLPEIAALAERLRRTAPALTLLVTSRERLELDDETAVELAPLVVPDDDHPGGAALDLFLERWESDTGPTDPDDLDDARRVCRAVEGIPLALELAAARARTFSLAEVADQTEQDPSALAELGRRRRGSRATLYAAVDRSHRLLDADEQLLHRSLAVLPGPFTVHGAAAVAGIDPVAAAALVAGLCHRSMLVARGTTRAGRPSTFAQLTMIRSHAARALAALTAGDDTGTVRDRRDAWVTGMVVGDRPRLGTPEEKAWSDALEDDLAALRSTLHRTLVERPSPRGVELVAGLGAMFWYQRDAMLEGERWTELAHAIVRHDPSGTSPVVRAQTTIVLATVQVFGRRTDVAAPLVDEALHLVTTGGLAADQEVVVGDALVVLAACLGLAGDDDRAQQVLDTVAAVVARTGDPTLALLHRVPVGLLELTRRDPGDVLRDTAALHRDALAVDNGFAAWIASGVAGLAALATGDAATALHWSDACLVAIDRTGRRHAPFQLEQRANTLAMLGRYEEASVLYGVARTHGEHAGLPWPSMPGTDELLRATETAVSRSTAARAGRPTVGELVTTIRAGQSQA